MISPPVVAIDVFTYELVTVVHVGTALLLRDVTTWFVQEPPGVFPFTLATVGFG